MAIFFTADTHFGHDREFMYVPRGFKSISEHDEAIIERWNSIVKPDDDVYHLGDIMLNDNSHGISCINRLNGNLHFLFGNHDTDARREIISGMPNVEILGIATIIRYKKYRFYLSHYPTITAYAGDGKPVRNHLINLYGHTHQKELFYNDNPYVYNIGLDAHNCMPVSVDSIIEDIKAAVSSDNSLGL